jgi:ribonuclease R
VDPRPPALDDLILDRLASLPHGRATAKTLLRELRLRSHDDRRRLDDALTRLLDRGRLIELRGAQFVLPSHTRDYATGRLNMHRDGYGFLLPDTPPPGLQGDIFIPPRRAAHAMHGDRVLVRILRFDPAGRPEGEVERVLSRAHPTVVGEFRYHRRGCFVIPHDRRILNEVLIPDGLELPPQEPNPDRIGAAAAPPAHARDLDHLIVNVELLDYPDGSSPDAIGRVVEILGHPDDFGVDVEVTIRKHHLPHRFPAEVLEQAQAIPATLRAGELDDRRDFRTQDCVTIDGETARDFDDAVWVDRTPEGHFLLHVHIADVAHYVRPGTPIDREAFLRGTSVYFPDRAVPMLPLELSTEICSLKPHVERLTLSALLTIDHRGAILHQDFCRSIIRSAARMTYTEVHAILEGDDNLRAQYRDLVPRFELMRELALILNRKRTRRGSIDFDLPEPIILFDDNGLMVSIARAPRNIAHRIIEEFMLAANEAVSSHLEARLPASVFRIHETPDPKRVAEFEETAARFGFSLGAGATPGRKFRNITRTSLGQKPRRDITIADPSFQVTARMYQKLVAQLEGRPEERIVSYLMLRSLKQARYSDKNLGHFALATPSYTHFTSPIRRYPDLLVHRLLGSLLDGAPASMPHLDAITAHCSDTERRAAEAERELMEWKKIKFMGGRLGDEFPALVISTTRFGFFVELDELYVEGLVPIDTLPGERWTFQENARVLRGERTRREIAAGDRLTVRLDRVDWMDRKLLFSRVVPESAPRNGKSRRKRK